MNAKNDSNLGAKRLWVLAQIQRSGMFNVAEYPSYRKAVQKLIDAGLVGTINHSSVSNVVYATILGWKEITAVLQPFPGILYDSRHTFVCTRADERWENMLRVFPSERVGFVRTQDFKHGMPLEEGFIEHAIIDLDIPPLEYIATWIQKQEDANWEEKEVAKV